MFLSKERKEKFKRLKELESLNFNIPRFKFLNRSPINEELDKILSWAINLSENNPEQIFNIRTYNYSNISKKESSQTVHLTDLSIEDLKKDLPLMISDYSCLIDAEIPDNGRLAGNIAIEDNNLFTIEFVIKEKRAMVRDVNDSPISLSGRIPDFPIILKKTFPNTTFFLTAPAVLDFVFNKALSLKKINTILEFTYFSIPSGIFYQKSSFPEANIVWWEYRTF